MKVKVTLSLIAITLLFPGCHLQTEKVHVRTKYHIHKVNFPGNEQTDGGSTDTFYFTTDGKRDIDTRGNTYKEERHGDTIARSTFDKSGKLIKSSLTILDSRGLEDSVVFRDASHVTFAHKYFYDDDSNLIEDRNYPQEPPNLSFKYKIVNGNRVEEMVTNIPADDTVMMPDPTTGEMEKVFRHYDHIILHNEFYTDKPNMPTNENFGYVNRDVGNKNLQKKSVQLSDKGDTVDIIYYKYIFDEKGRVISVAQISRSGQEYDSTAYTYY